MVNYDGLEPCVSLPLCFSWTLQPLYCSDSSCHLLAYPLPSCHCENVTCLRTFSTSSHQKYLQCQQNLSRPFVSFSWTNWLFLVVLFVCLQITCFGKSTWTLSDIFLPLMLYLLGKCLIFFWNWNCHWSTLLILGTNAVWVFLYNKPADTNSGSLVMCYLDSLMRNLLFLDNKTLSPLMRPDRLTLFSIADILSLLIGCTQLEEGG